MSADFQKLVRKYAPAKPSVVFVVVMWFSLAGSVLGVMDHLVVKRLGIRWYLCVSQDFIWMAPVADVLIFLVPALFLVLLCRLFPGKDYLPAALFIGSFLFLLKVLMLMGYLHPVAMLLLALGVASQAATRLKNCVYRVQSFLELSTGTFAMMFVVLAVTQIGSRTWAEWQGQAQLPAAAPGAPNVLFVTLDTVAADHLSLHGNKRLTTPYLDQWAKKGAWFKTALATAPWTLPSHASMFTGRYPHELSTTWSTPLDATHPTLAEALRDRGYATAGFVANRFYTSYESGLGRGFLHYEDFDYSPGEFIQSSVLSKSFFNLMLVRNFMDCYDIFGRKKAESLNRSFLDWLDGQDGDHPFFAFVNYFDAHDPYLPPSPFDARFGPPMSGEDVSLSLQWWRLKHADLPAERLDTAERAYDSCLAYLDHQLGKLLDELERRGVLENTLIVITSDHGEQFGKHHLYLHGQSLYRELIHVPLILIQPGRVPAGLAVEEFVTLRDVAATVLDLTGVANHPLPGSSLARFWTGTDADSSMHQPPTGSPVLQVAFPIPGGYRCAEDGCSPVASGSIVSLFKSGKHYIKNVETGKEEIYDFANDPEEIDNLALSPTRQPMLEDFRLSIQEIFAVHKSRWVDFP